MAAVVIADASPLIALARVVIQAVLERCGE
jgi:hypothetical protein